MDNIKALFDRVCDRFCGNAFGTKTFEEYLVHCSRYPKRGSEHNNILEFLSAKLPEEIQRIYLTVLGRECELFEVNQFCERFKRERFSLIDLEKSLKLSEERTSYEKKLDQLEKFIHESGKIGDYNKYVKNGLLKGKNIKVIAPIGRSGFAHSSKSYFVSLFRAGANLTFEVHRIHHELTSSKSNLDKIVYVHIGREVHYDSVIIMSSPNEWSYWIKKERLLNPNVKIYGNTFWECDKVDPRWSEYFNMTDGIIAACEFNRATFQNATTKPVHLVHIPILSENVTTRDVKVDILDNLSDKVCTVFYTINEWSNRKGIEELIQCFLKTFTKKDPVILYIKANGVDKKKTSLWLKQETDKYECPARVVWDDRCYSDEEISAIHHFFKHKKSCYISLTKGEAIGMGACDAAMLGTPVIMTGFGGQVDYLKGIFYVGYSLTKPNMCNPLTAFDHSMCKDHCHQYIWFNDSQQWGQPNLEEASQLMRMFYDSSEPDEKNMIARNYLLSFRNADCTAKEFANVL